MRRLLIFWLGMAAVVAPAAEPADPLAQKFARPPADTRPWVYWFWNNANVTSNGITADLEAMQRVGIGGVLIMDVFERYAPPRGSAEFMNPEWQGLFQFSVQECARLGLKINMANGPGWTGSSGPWITPALSMQKLVWTNLIVTGPTNWSAPFPKPSFEIQTNSDWPSKFQAADYYEDIGLLAFPATTNGFVSTNTVIDLTAKLGADGKLIWAVPPGEWTIERIGHTTTGSSTRPPVVGGNGLECDKLNRAGMDAQFAGMMAKLIHTAGPLAGKTLVATHIDSWEVGAQNWTGDLREEFLKRRGYDPLPWLPCLTIATHEQNDETTRFRWDFDETIAELLAENYSGRLAELAHTNGLRFTLEGYDLPFGDEFTYAARADEPMTEFWTPGEFGQDKTVRKAEEMASVAHVYGRPIVGAEAFTSGDHELWKLAPADLKALGDFEFSQGVNRFVIHRYAHQPYLDRAPGATMGPWGLHYERTQTWWEMSGAWHKYLARCQFMLRQGKFVADLLYLRPENPNQTYFTPNPPPPAGYRFDEISAEALVQRVSVKDGKLVLPDGMNYRVLVLPPETAMTPLLAEKIYEVVSAGATVLTTAPHPTHSPSLQDFPACDAVVAKVGKEIWGDCDGQNVTEHASGQGKLIWGRPLEKVLEGLEVAVDFSADTNLNWIHRRIGETEIYFVANPTNFPCEAICHFRVAGRQPELWDPETGARRDLPDFLIKDGGTTVPLRFEPAQSFFVVFRKPAGQPQSKNNFPGHEIVSEITGPWQLSFPPKWGAPDSVLLTNLISWTDSSDDGVRHFSGTATYGTTFDLPAGKIKSEKAKLFLDLGDVQVMARVIVNDQDCGVAWKTPFRVEITKAVRPGSNSLEIQVANLWPNRMIGDVALPWDKRFTWSSWHPFTEDAPLLKSGLIGPVRIEVENELPKCDAGLK